MAILSRFIRDDRFEEVEGCPLAAGGAEDESACAGCSYNVLAAGRGRVGCVLSTPFADYERALGRLHEASAADHARLSQILENERRKSDRDALGNADLEAVRDIAGRWEQRLGNDEGERLVVAALKKFSEAGLAMGEPVRILA